MLVQGEFFVVEMELKSSRMLLSEKARNLTVARTFFNLACRTVQLGSS